MECGVSGTSGISKNTVRPYHNALLLSGKLNSFLADIDQQAQERMDTIIQQMAQGITEVMKAADPMAWVGRMNNIQKCAREMVGE